MEIEFAAWPKISRLANEKMTITEKIDGSNACVVMMPDDKVPFGFSFAAQSRTRLITPENDNFGFARWAYAHIDELWTDLGPGRHFGEWWGSGIQRGYGLEKGEKRLSLFNAYRWTRAFEDGHTFKTPQLGVVPLLYSGPFDQANAMRVVAELYHDGSWAAPGFPTPEGVVVHLKDAQTTYKITDAVPGEKERFSSE